MRFDCLDCGHHAPAMQPHCGCDACGGLLTVDLGPITPATGWRDRPLGVWRYKEWLPHHADQEPISLSEGGTPLLDLPRLAQQIGVKRLRVKFEGANPTGSFKDRGMTAAVSWAVGQGATVLGCASTGNTAASMAAYAGRAGVHGVVLLPAGQVAIGKVAQSLAHGANVLEVEGNFDDAMAAVANLAKDGHVALLNSKNPIRLEGQKTLMWEILDQCAGPAAPADAIAQAAPDRVVYPVGNAGNISAAHKAILEWQRDGLLGDDVPRLTGSQAAGAAPITQAIQAGAERETPVANPETIATAIRIGKPVSAIKALRAIRETNGTATAVTDEQISTWQGRLAREGVFCEPASAASVAGLAQLAADGHIDADEDVVCVLTGHGLKDPSAGERIGGSMTRVACNEQAILEAMK